MTGLPISVIVPTIGRPDQLERCVESLAECSPGPAEVLVIDQSGMPEVAAVVERFRRIGARTVPCMPPGIARATNLGLRTARQDAVAITHDDCTVSEDWVGVASSLMAADDTAIYTGQVLPAGDPDAIPSTIDDPVPHDYTGRPSCRVLYPSNMVCDRRQLLSFGAFDPAFRLAAEDNDLCYRWLRAGNRLLYEPALRVWHHDWRSPDELRAVHRSYGEGQGLFYAKHLRRGDLRMVRFLAEDTWGIGKASVSAILRGQPEKAGAPLGLLRGLPTGLRRGWREFR